MIITNNAHNIPRNSFQGNLINKVKPVKTNVASKLKPLAKDTFVKNIGKNKSFIQKYMDKLSLKDSRRISLTNSLLALGLSTYGLITSNTLVNLLGFGIILSYLKISNKILLPKILENTFLGTNVDENEEGKLIVAPYENISSRTDNKPNTHPIQVIARSLFLENYTKDESLDIAKKYKKILEIENDEEFLEKAAIELLKDFNLGGFSIRLNLIDGSCSDKKDTVFGSCKLNSHYNYHKIEVSPDERLEMFKTLVHEICHIKQEILAVKSCSEDEYIEKKALYVLNLLKKCTNLSSDKVENLISSYIQSRLDFYKGKGINFNSMSKFDINYFQARKLFEELNINVNESDETYLKSASEQGAKIAEFLAEKLIKDNYFINRGIIYEDNAIK